MSNANQPVKKLRLGRVSCAIWENTGEHGSHFTVTFERSFIANEHWQTTTSFGRDDLHLLAMLATEAEQWIYRHRK